MCPASLGGLLCCKEPNVWRRLEAKANKFVRHTILTVCSKDNKTIGVQAVKTKIRELTILAIKIFHHFISEGEPRSRPLTETNNPQGRYFCLGIVKGVPKVIVYADIFWANRMFICARGNDGFIYDFFGHFCTPNSCFEIL